MIKLNILSPHLDDAVLSNWHQIEQPNSQVITLFAGIPKTSKRFWWDRLCGLPNGDAAMKIRRKENHAALSQIDTPPIDLDYLDEQYKPEARNIDEIADTIEGVTDEDSSFVACTAIGTLFIHADHITTRKVALELHKRGRNVTFYIDIPYALIFRRLNNWPAHLSKAKLERALGMSVVIEPYELSQKQIESKKKAAQAYQSQLKAGNVFSFGALKRDGAYRWEVIVRPSAKSI